MVEVIDVGCCIDGIHGLKSSVLVSIATMYNSTLLCVHFIIQLYGTGHSISFRETAESAASERICTSLTGSS